MIPQNTTGRPKVWTPEMDDAVASAKSTAAAGDLAESLGVSRNAAIGRRHTLRLAANILACPETVATIRGLWPTCNGETIARQCRRFSQGALHRHVPAWARENPNQPEARMLAAMHKHGMKVEAAA